MSPLPVVFFVSLFQPTAAAPPLRGINTVLNAAGFTYVAAFPGSLAWFLVRLLELAGLHGGEE